MLRRAGRLLAASPSLSTLAVLGSLLVPPLGRFIRLPDVERRELPELRADLYFPPGRSSPALVLVLGALREGRRYEPLEAVARALAGCGHAVLVPELGRLRELVITEAALDDLVAAALALPGRPEVAGDRVGLVGFSLGGGLALVAAGDERLGGHVSCVASLGGYFSLADMRALAESGTADLEQPVLDAIAGSLAAAGGESAPGLAASMERLSPSSVLGDLDIPVWSLHDVNDRYVPVEQARHLEAAAGGRRNFHFFRTSLLEHTEPRPLPVNPATLAGSYLPSLLSLARFLRGALGALRSGARPA